jgi:hypothetical protein
LVLKAIQEQTELKVFKVKLVQPVQTVKME